MRRGQLNVHVKALVKLIAAEVVQVAVIQHVQVGVKAAARGSVIHPVQVDVKMDVNMDAMVDAKQGVRCYAQVDARHHVKMGVQMHVVDAKVVVHMTVLIVKTVVREAV